jgi:hypothetical protein
MYEQEKTQTGMTSLAGLSVYLDLAKVIGLSKSIQKHLKVRENSQVCLFPWKTAINCGSEVSQNTTACLLK